MVISRRTEKEENAARRNEAQDESLQILVAALYRALLPERFNFSANHVLAADERNAW
jgi:hypothetical protein